MYDKISVAVPPLFPIISRLKWQLQHNMLFELSVCLLDLEKYRMCQQKVMQSIYFSFTLYFLTGGGLPPAAVVVATVIVSCRLLWAIQ